VIAVDRVRLVGRSSLVAERHHAEQAEAWHGESAAQHLGGEQRAVHERVAWTIVRQVKRPIGTSSMPPRRLIGRSSRSILASSEHDLAAAVPELDPGPHLHAIAHARGGEQVPALEHETGLLGDAVGALPECIRFDVAADSDATEEPRQVRLVVVAARDERPRIRRDRIRDLRERARGSTARHDEREAERCRRAGGPPWAACHRDSTKSSRAERSDSGSAR
jgi:hypothetical protein